MLGSGFDEQTGTQVGQHDPDPVVRGVAGVDLQVLSEPESVKASLDLAIEDGHSARFSPARTIGKVAAEQGVRISSTEEGLRFVDENGGARPSGAPEGPTVLETFANRLTGSAGFNDPATGYTPPDGWTLENKEIRARNADKLREVSGRLREGTLTAREALTVAEEHRRTLTNL